MKKQDTIKVVIAVACLALAGVLFFVLNSGGGSSNESGGQTIGTSGEGTGEGGRMSVEEVQELAEEEGVDYGGVGPVKPTPRRR